MSKVQPRTLSGFMELLPARQAQFDRMVEILRRTYGLYGFTPLDTPLIEASEVLLAKGGGETEKQIYRFLKGDTDLSLRFDLTVPLAKYVALNYGQLTFPFRRFQIGKVYRGERAQRGRFREFYQADIDVIGDGALDISNEAEIPSIIYRAFTALGLKRFQIRVNNRKILNGFYAMLGLSQQSGEIMRTVDKLDKIGPDKVAELLVQSGLSPEQAREILSFTSITGTNEEVLTALEGYRGRNEVFDLGLDELNAVTPTDDCKEWLGRVAKLYADGVIDPSIITDTDRDEEMANGGFGATYSWVSWNNPSSGTMQSFYASNPDAEWIPIDMVSGDNGNPQDEPATIAAWCYFGITNVCSDPERAYAIFDDMATPENWIHKKFGVEGRDYKDNGDGTYEIINPGDGAVNTEQNLGINLFQDLFARKDAANIANTEETTELFEKVKENSRDAYAKTIEKKNPDAYTVNNDLGTDIGDAMKEYTWGVIGGGKSLDDWDSYVDKINGLGLQDVLDELKEIHGKQVEDYQKYLEEYNK